ncbi:MAG: hypothetical protein HYV00_02345 [Deltaproteobacteria bacterium]|nr:hypothetical protein [Deltaproteobacteria bacterium]
MSGPLLSNRSRISRKPVETSPGKRFSVLGAVTAGAAGLGAGGLVSGLGGDDGGIALGFASLFGSPGDGATG